MPSLLTPEELRYQSGPCSMCGAVNYPLSFGGPSICPSCDCGATNPVALRKHIASLTARLELADAVAKAAWLFFGEEASGYEDELGDALAAWQEGRGT